MARNLLGLALVLAATAASGAEQDWDKVLSREFGGLQLVGVQKERVAAPDRRLTPLLVLARQHWDELSADTQALVRPWMLRPTDGGNLIHPSIAYANPEATPIDTAHFRVHYIDRATYPGDPNAATSSFASQVASVMEEVWTAQHTTLGYAAVPSDVSVLPQYGGNGGDGRYDVYLADVGGLGIYGYVTSDQAGTSETARPYGSHSYMVLDDDYAEFPPDSLQVTAAHEYFHAVQFGYDYMEDVAFMEQSSTWMEDMVYPLVHDNYQYIGEPYTDSNGNGQYTFGEAFVDRNGNGQRDEGSTEYPEVPLDGFDIIPGIQYGRFLWPRYLTERHGAGVMRSAWESCGTVRGDNTFTAVNGALAAVGASLRSAYQEYAVWGYDTAQFDDGANYPRVWVDASSSATAANFSSATTPSLVGMEAAGYPTQMHMSTIYEQVVAPQGSYTFAAVGGDPAVTMVVQVSGGALRHEELPLSGGTGVWNTPGDAEKVVAVISNASPTADCMAWVFRSGSASTADVPPACTTDTGGGGGGGVLDLGMLALGLGLLARRRFRIA